MNITSENTLYTFHYDMISKNRIYIYIGSKPRFFLYEIINHHIIVLLYPCMVFIYWYEWFIPTIIEFGRKLNFFRICIYCKNTISVVAVTTHALQTKFWWFIERKGHILRFLFLYVWFLWKFNSIWVFEVFL